jgi:molybdopterin-containing oxidoreductase family iron-sulfur binding subunit
MPYAQQPENLIPGRPLYFATAMTIEGVAQGILAESHEGRPTKIEGNPQHPATLGAASPFLQASVLQLYDPDRSQNPTFEGTGRSWGDFQAMLGHALAQQAARYGAGIRVLTETMTSPTIADQFRQIQKTFPGARWHAWDPAGAHTARAGTARAFGHPVNTYYDVARADVIVSLDSDFLASGPAALRYARQFAARRRVRGTDTAMNRLYVVEPMPSATGSKADHRLPMRASEVEEFAWALAAALGVARRPLGAEAVDAKWIGAVARDLESQKGSSLVIPGDYQPPEVHVLAHMMNTALGNLGRTVFHTDSIEASPADQVASLDALMRDLDAGVVDLLLVLGGNPVFDTPVEIGMHERIQKARLRIHLSQYHDETSNVCQWHLPETHYLETWGDARAFDGTVTIQQPLIEPLYDGRSVLQVLNMLTDQPLSSAQELLKTYWSSQHKGDDFEVWWRRAVHDGVVPHSALPIKSVTLRSGALGAPAKPAPSPSGLEVIFRPDPAIYDGRFANNGWLQELPKPITKLTWDNAAIMSPATAARLGVVREPDYNYGAEGNPMVEMTYQGRNVRAPVWIQPGHANDAVTLHLGYGRTTAGRVGTGVGFNPYGLRTSKALWHDTGLEARKISGSYLFATTQNQHALDTRRHIYRQATLEQYRKDPQAPHAGAENPASDLTLYPAYKYDGYAWGMAIDLTACIGCGACVVACQAENNIAVVGKDQVCRGRSMQWLRVDTYYSGDPNNPRLHNQPVPCMQCEEAPCELVCPVQATTHSAEGLNDMVYNRCVGTRYCSNNCPYKVRRFNFYLFSDYETPSLKLLRNPDVTVRSRGVMEKCTYCVQRINAAKIDSERENRKVRDGDIQTACQATCPTEAIIFGDINDPNSRVAKVKREKLNYAMLADLNTRPRTTYLASLCNPNPEIEG